MGFGLAFTDVLADALMVENGREHGLTGAFQSVQWAAIYVSSILVGLIGGWFAQRRNLDVRLPAGRRAFPLISLVMVTAFVREKRARGIGPRSCERLAAVRERAARARGLAGGRLHLLLHVQPVVRAGLPLLPDGRARVQSAVHRRR